MGRKRRISCIRITLVSPDGKQTSEVILPVDQTKSVRRFGHEGWGREESIRRFRWYLARGDQNGIEASYDALVRHECLGDALQDCMSGTRPNMRKTRALLLLWNARGLWSLPRALGDNLAIFTDAIRYFAPTYDGDTLTLYRGQSRDRYERGIFGIAWTTQLAIAEQFAPFRDTPGVVLELQATPELIVAHVPDFISTPKTNPESNLEFEDEYLVDLRALSGRVRVRPWDIL